MGYYRRFFVYAFLSGLRLDRWLWIVYLTHRGFSLAEIGIAKVVFDITVLVTEVPTGYLADRYGKRWFLVAGGVAAAGSALALVHAQTMTIVVLAMFLRALAFTLPSGSDTAYLNEAVVADNAQKQLGAVLGRYTMLSSLGQFLGGIFGGVLAEFSWVTFYWTDLGFAFGRIVSAAVLPAIRVREQVPDSERERQHADGRGRLRRLMPHIGVLALLAIAATYWSASTVKFMFAQPLLLQRGLGPGFIAAALSITDLLSMAGSHLAGRLPPRFEVSQIVMWSAVADAIFTGLLLVPVVHVTVLVLAGSQVLIGISSVVIPRDILQRAPGNLHATLLSSLGTATTLLSAGGLVLAGALNNLFGASSVLVALTAALAALATTIWLSHRIWGISSSPVAESSAVTAPTQRPE